MSYTITGQRPAVLNPAHTIPVANDYDPVPAITEVLIDPLFEPLTSGSPVTITDTNANTQLDVDDVTQLVMDGLSPSVNAPAEDKLKSLYTQGLQYYDPQTPKLFKSGFATQAGTQRKLPTPNPGVLYTARTDVVPAAKSMLAQQGRIDDAEFLATLSYTYNPETLAYWFQTPQAFDDFVEWLKQEINMISNILDPSVLGLFNQFFNLSLKKLTESLRLRKDDSDGNEPYSFARVLIHMLSRYFITEQTDLDNGTVDQQTLGMLPFSMTELFLPQTVVLVNLEAHARASARKVDREWKLINQSLAAPIKVLSHKKLSKLTSLNRSITNAHQAASLQSNKQQKAGRTGKVTFKKRPPTKVDIANDLIRTLKRMKSVNMSMNTLKQVKKTSSRPNRRDPNNPNLLGKRVSKKYIPDLHIYLDTSGSISEHHYQDAVMLNIELAKKLNVNLYLTSFSHVLSQTTLLKVRGKSINAIWEQFRAIPKVTGGTDFAQIWRYINISKKRRQELSLIITDFEWFPDAASHVHPPNVYYAPISAYSWQHITYWAKNFAKSMEYIDPTIHSKFIGILK